jgi:hypothetical protein
MELAKDTPTDEAQHPHPQDPHQTGSGSTKSPGGSESQAQNAGDMTQGGESYPGPRSGGESDKIAPKTGENRA